MTENEFRSIVVKMLEPLAAFPVENIVAEGTPDVCSTAGWIEMKLADLPQKETTRVAIDLRKSQRDFLRRWTRTGARAWTLTIIQPSLQDQREHWLLHGGKWASEFLGNVPFNELVKAAVGHWTERPSSADFVAALINRSPL